MPDLVNFNEIIHYEILMKYILIWLVMTLLKFNHSWIIQAEL